MAAPRRFVDAHIHLWDLDQLSYPWLTPPFAADGVNGDISSIAHTYLPGDYLADARSWQVAGLVHVDAGARAEQALAETQWLETVLGGAGLPFALVAFAALDDPKLEGVLEQHLEYPHVRGIRHIANYHPDPAKTYNDVDLLMQPRWRHGLGQLARHGLSFDLQIYPAQMASAAALARENPELQIVLNHAGMPIDRDAAGLASWSSGMRNLAAEPNVSVKLSGFGIVEHDWTTSSIRPFVLEAIEAFGTRRCMFASDVPTDKVHANFDTIMGAYDDITAGFAETERDDMFAANAWRTYRLGDRA
jgi:predicted TIM-barrel fold metal-dependent hydrolase